MKQIHTNNRHSYTNNVEFSTTHNYNCINANNMIILFMQTYIQACPSYTHREVHIPEPFADFIGACEGDTQQEQHP